MTNKILIVGTQGLFNQIYPHIYNEIINDNVIFFDDVISIDILHGCKVIHNWDEIPKDVDRFIIAVANPLNRYKLSLKCVQLGLNGLEEYNIIAEDVLIPNSSQVDKNVIILRQSIIEENVNIGYGSLINLGAIIAHDSKLGQFCEICPRATILGGVTLEGMNFIGSGAIIAPKVKIGYNTIIGANAFINKDVPPNSKVFGTPGKIFSK